MDAFDSVNFTSGHIEERVISTPPEDLPVDQDGGGEPCVIA